MEPYTFNPPELKDPNLNPPAQVQPLGRAGASKMRRSKSFENLQQLKIDDTTKKKKKSLFTKNSAKLMKFKESKVVKDILEDKKMESDEKLLRLEERKRKIRESYDLYMTWLSNMEKSKSLTFENYKSIREMRRVQTNSYYQDVDDVANSIDYVKYMKNMDELQEVFSTKRVSLEDPSKSDGSDPDTPLESLASAPTPEKKVEKGKKAKPRISIPKKVWEKIRSPKVSQQVLPMEEDMFSEQAYSSGEVFSGREVGSSSVTNDEISVEFVNDLELISNPNIDPITERGFVFWGTKIKGEMGKPNSPEQRVFSTYNSPTREDTNALSNVLSEAQSEMASEGPLDFLTPNIRPIGGGGGEEDSEEKNMKMLIDDVVRYFLE